MTPRLLSLIIVASCATCALAAGKTMTGDELFSIRIWPLLKERCLSCHGDDPAKIKSGFDMRTNETFLKGGDSEAPPITAGKPDESPLFLSVMRTHKDWKAMPPKENDRLSTEQISWIRQWIAAGASWPNDARRAELARQSAKWSTEDGVTVKTIGALSDEWAGRRYKKEGLWAYQPLHATTPAILKDGQNPIDTFIAQRMPEGLEAAPPCDARTFIRRASFDLLGLPPTPEEITDFESASIRDPQSAIRSLIDRLLASPHYGEHWARHWLDVVRYADTSGFANDYERGNAWRYRDYIVRAFNNDKPYDQFIREQIAGDELHPDDPEMLVATGFLRMGPWELTGMEVAKIARQRFLDDVTNSVGETFLSQSLQCARCHDHKFDPVPTHDHYAIQAVFATTQLSERPAAFLPAENTQGFDEKRYLEKHVAEHEAVLAELDAKLLKNAEAWFAEKKIDRGAWDKAVAQLRTPHTGTKLMKGRAANSIFEAARMKLANQGIAEDQYPPKQLGFSVEDYGRERVARKGLERLKWELDRYEPVAFSVYDGRTPQMVAVLSPQRMPVDRMTKGELEETFILAIGNPFSPVKKVEPGVLSVIASMNPGCTANVPNSIEGRRTALANWIARADNPLTTRAIANRIWLWHFGQPIAGNPNNFGSTGKRPTHPELLDWLAAAFVKKGWSFKDMHRIIMTSDAYRRSCSHPDPKLLTKLDPLGESYAVFKPRRLTAEEFRDTMLSASGELNPEMGGIPNRPEMNLEAALQPRQVMGTFAAAWVPNPLPAQRHRRSLYSLKIRGQRDPTMEVLNEPAPDFSCERRDASTVTPQVFAMFNSSASADRALALANRVMQEKHDHAGAIDRIFQLTLGRAPAPDEAKECLGHWHRMTGEQEAIRYEEPAYPKHIIREAVEENTGQKFSFAESLDAYADFVPDLKPADVDARTRGLADVCLVLLNSNEFAYVY